MLTSAKLLEWPFRLGSPAQNVLWTLCVGRSGTSSPFSKPERLLVFSIQRETESL
jgi:hypothetical protein